MSCVVCTGQIGEPHYANAWEKSRKLYPCCCPACAQRFDPDIHWIPVSAPDPISGPDEARLLADARRRIAAGDRPSLVVRDNLIAGVGIPGVRKLLIEGELAANAGDATARRLNIIGVVRALFGGALSFAERADKQDPKLLRAAEADLDAWQARFGKPK
jgi:hypothetical protein